MKRIVICSVCVLILVTTSCAVTSIFGGDDSGGDEGPITPMTVQELTGPHLQALIAEGDQLFNDVYYSYYQLKGHGTDVLPQVLNPFADYFMYPFGFDGERSFTERMEDDYWSDGGIQTVYDNVTAKGIEDQTIDLDDGITPSFVDMVFSAVNLGNEIMKTYEMKKQTQVLERQVDLLESQGRQLREMDALMQQQYLTMRRGQEQTNQALQSLEAALSDQIDDLGMDLESFRQETMVQFGNLNARIDEVIEQLSDIKGDISALSADVAELTDITISQPITDAIAYLNSFYAEAESIVDEDDFVDFLRAYRVNFNYHFSRFVSAAIALQDFAADNDYYPEFARDSVSPYVPRYQARITYNGLTDYDFTYPNAVALVPISYGNLEYIYKFIMTRFIMNQYLYSGDALTAKNAEYAELYLDLIRQFKAPVVAAMDTLEFEYDQYVSYVNSDFSSLYGTGNDITYRSWDRETESYESLGSISTDDMLTNLRDHLSLVFLDYLGPFAAELMSLEIDLMAYVADEENERFRLGNIKWSYPAGDGYADQDAALAFGPDGTIYVGDSVTDELVAIDPEQGELWRVSMPYEAGEEADPIAIDGNGRIYAVAQTTLYAIDTGGNELWSYDMPDTPTAPAIDHQNRVLIASDTGTVGDGDGTLVCLQSDGTPAWTTTIADLAGPPVVDGDNNVIVVTATYSTTGGSVISYDSLGEENWRYNLSGIVSVHAPSVGPDGTVYYGGSDGLRAIDQEGTLKWSYETSGAVTPVIDPSGNLYFATYGSEIHCVESDGTRAWRTVEPFGKSLGYCRVALDASGRVYSTTLDDSVISLTSEGFEIRNSPLPFSGRLGPFERISLNPNGDVMVLADELVAIHTGATAPGPGWSTYRADLQNSGRAATD